MTAFQSFPPGKRYISLGMVTVALGAFALVANSTREQRAEREREREKRERERKRKRFNRDGSPVSL